MNKLNVCPGTLKPGFETYSPRCIKEVFLGSVIDHVLPFHLPEEGADTFLLKLHRRKISLADDGQYILKTAPTDIINAEQYPANAHLTMQLASQVFDIPTANCALIFLEDGRPAYITRRFDIKKNGETCKVDDFASLARLTEAHTGAHYRYQLSYFEMSQLIDKYFPAAILAKEQLFRMVVFNYLFSNGDAHLENFSRIDCEGNSDGLLAPAYNLVNTALHGDDGDLALLGGLYHRDFEKLSFKTLGYYGYDDFFQFGMKIGMVSFRVKRFMDQLLGSREEVAGMISRSFLSDDMKAEYYRLYEARHGKLSTSFSGLNKA
ncbi:MAG TPA: HipA domain-containing protein [Chitinophagaceae bacterium]|nr:HipA domain-containing protein [Chitinophagaceae bacterium]